MNETKIQWCDFSANVIKYRDADGKSVWACAKVSDGCKNCYSEAIAHRYGRGGPFTLQQLRKTTPYFDDVEAGKILRSKKLSGKRVFIGDMTDCFGEWVPFEILDKLFATFALRQDVTFQVLTKRPERMAEYLPKGYPGRGTMYDAMHALDPHFKHDPDDENWDAWPLPNVWLGTSVENQKTADERISHLLACPAAIRFISAEPLLGPIDLMATWGKLDGTTLVAAHGLDWVIVGGESGAGARPCDVQWVRSIVEQCKLAGVAAFVKQLGSKPVVWDSGRGDEFSPDAPGYSQLGYQGYPLRDRKGGTMEEWPMDLRVREMPLAKVEVA